MFDLQMIGLKIVHELGTLIEQDVVVIDHNGYVLASTDNTRLNQFHEGSLMAMKRKESVHMTYELTQKLQGVREGMVIPLIIEGSPIGVIGVTGKPEEIEKYGKLVQKITQLFVEDFLRHKEQEREQRLFDFFMVDLLNRNITKELALQRAENLKIDTSLYDRIILIQVGRRFDLKEMSDLRQNQFIHPQIKVMQWSYDKLLLLVPKVSRAHLTETLASLVSKMERIYKVDVQVGVGNTYALEELAQSYEQALLALSSNSKGQKIIYQEDLKLELLLANVSQPTIDEFLARTIGPLVEDTELLENLATWLQSNEPLNDIAETLHIHKNTLKYRLKKIEKLLGVSLNERVHQVELIIAIYLYKKTR